mgnify:CR=1 FL=1
MKIIAGHFRGITIEAPKGLKFRPTANLVREAVFNVLASRIQGSVVLDLFAGSGAYGFEAMSRGASRVVFVDLNRVACDHIRRVGKKLNLGDEIQTLNMSADQAVKTLLTNGRKFSVIFLDPPYYSDMIYKLFSYERFMDLLTADGLIIFEGPGRCDPPTGPVGSTHLFSRKYGETVVNMYSQVGAHENEV